MSNSVFMRFVILCAAVLVIVTRCRADSWNGVPDPLIGCVLNQRVLDQIGAALKAPGVHLAEIRCLPPNAPGDGVPADSLRPELTAAFGVRKAPEYWFIFRDSTRKAVASFRCESDGIMSHYRGLSETFDGIPASVDRIEALAVWDGFLAILSDRQSLRGLKELVGKMEALKSDLVRMDRWNRDDGKEGSIVTFWGTDTECHGGFFTKAKYHRWALPIVLLEDASAEYHVESVGSLKLHKQTAER